MSKPFFPEQPGPLDKMIVINTPRQLGIAAPILVKEAARKLSAYDTPIESVEMGEDSEGNKIQINSVGRWLFGVPGYNGHVRVVAENANVFLYYPSAAPQEVHDLIIAVKQAIETSE